VTDEAPKENITVRPAEPDDLPAVAELRWRWVLEHGEHGDTPSTPTVEHADFVSHFVTWAQENASTHRCTVLVRDTVIAGMAWLAVLPRVPSPRALHRASGDLQCVYVVPDARDGGLGGRLIEATLAAARDLGLERVTVHSSPRAIPAYARHGFEPSDRLLHSHVARTTPYP
jgi:GNAT superfamily N-acetyltransferase